MRLYYGLVFLASAISLPWVAADVKFTVPAAGASIPGGTAFTVTWADSGNAPALGDLTSATVMANNKLVTGTTGPDTVNAVVSAAAAGSTAAAAGAIGDPWAIPYNLQIGLTKYAPMQSVPPTAIVTTNTKPLWPTSAVQFATTLLPIPSEVTTLTRSMTWSVSSRANTAAAAAAMPADDMQKLLARWKD